MKKKILSVVLMLILALQLSACGESSSGESNSGAPSSQSSETVSDEVAIKLEDISWELKEEISGKHKYTDFLYTNNSNRIITRLEAHFSEKAGMTDADKEKAFNELQSYYGKDRLSNDDVNTLKQKSFTMHATDRNEVAPGENNSDDPARMCYMEGSMYVQFLEHCDFVELSTIEIKYVNDDNLIDEISFDAKTGESTFKAGKEKYKSKNDKESEDASDNESDDTTADTDNTTSEPEVTESPTENSIVDHDYIEDESMSVEYGYEVYDNNYLLGTCIITNNDSEKAYEDTKINVIAYDTDNKVIDTSSGQYDRFEPGDKIADNFGYELNGKEVGRVEVSLSAGKEKKKDENAVSWVFVQTSDVKVKTKKNNKITLTGKARNAYWEKKDLQVQVVLRHNGKPILMLQTDVGKVKPYKTKKFKFSTKEMPFEIEYDDYYYDTIPLIY